MNNKKCADTYENLLCPFCASVIKCDDKFCPVCGNEITDSVKKEMELNNEKRKLKAKKRRKNFIISSVCALVIVIGLVFTFAGIPSIQYSLASNKISTTYNDFVEEKMSYAEAYKIIKEYSNSEDSKIKYVYTTYYKKLSDLNSSRESYPAGIEAAENKDYQKAIINLKKVIETDKNYEDAQNKITEIIPIWKNVLLEEVSALEKNGNYSTAINKLKVFNAFSSDSDISSKIYVLNDKQEKQKIEEYKNNQEVVVISCRAYDDGYYYTNRKAEVVIKNLSEKVLKTANIVILQFDDNGYPVDGEYEMYNYDNIANSMNASANSVNISYGQTCGKNRHWGIADRATKIKAIVYEAEYIDGSTWTNPYVEYWLEAEKDRY